MQSMCPPILLRLISTIVSISILLPSFSGHPRFLRDLSKLYPEWFSDISCGRHSAPCEIFFVRLTEITYKLYIDIFVVLNFGVTSDVCECEVEGVSFECDDCYINDLCTWCKENGLQSEYTEELDLQNNPGEVAGVKVSEASAVPPERTDDIFVTKWSPVQPGMAFRRKPIDSSDQEYKTVIANVMDADGQQWTNKVKQVCRIENRRMYKIYLSCKDEMERENEPGFQNERILWHGTSVDVLSNIYRDGFNRSYCGKNATAYGDGVYFATLFEYSTSRNYSPPDANGQKYIFQCRVLTGHFTDGQKGLKEPPMRTDELRYDSVVDQIANPTIFVIFKDMQVYPEYVITLEV